MGVSCNGKVVGRIEYCIFHTFSHNFAKENVFFKTLLCCLELHLQVVDEAWKPYVFRLRRYESHYERFSEHVSTFGP